MLFSEEQVDKILSSYEWMHKTITRTMQERENDILPLLYRESAFVPRVKPSSFKVFCCKWTAESISIICLCSSLHWQRDMS